MFLLRYVCDLVTIFIVAKILYFVNEANHNHQHIRGFIG